MVDLVNNRVLIHEEPAGDSYSRTKTRARGETLHVSAGDSRVEMPVDRFLP